MKTGFIKLLIGMTVLCCFQAQASVEVTSFSVNERDGTVDAMVTLTTTDPCPSDPDVTVYYWTEDGTAKAGDGDYVGVMGKLHFSKFDTPQAVMIQILQDMEIEDPENFSLVASLEPPPCDFAAGAGASCATTGGQLASGDAGGVQEELPGAIEIVDDDTSLEVNVIFPAGNPIDVPVTLLCNNGNIDAATLGFGHLNATKSTTGGTALFELIDYLPDWVCVAYQTEGAPEGYVQSYTNCDPSLNPSALTCDIENTRSVQLNNNDGLGDAGIFQYYTVNGGWQTFIRVINTSSDAVSVKVRFREAANSREVLDFIIFLSPYDAWAGWTDADATNRGLPGVRTMDTSCLYPQPDTNNTTEGWKTISGNLLGAEFQERAFTGGYKDNGNDFHTSIERMSEGHLEIIGIAAHEASSPFGRAVSHDHFTGKPWNCTEASNLFEAQAEGGEGSDLGNVLSMNGYVINVALGQGGGFDPDILTYFTEHSLVSESLLTATDPDMDTAFSVGPVIARDKQKGYLGVQPVTGGVDAVSYEFQRTSVMNEWAASANPGNVVSDYYTQWILTFPTKHYYVDLQNDTQPLDDISPTLVDPNENSNSNDAYAPFYEEFDDGYNEGKSCEDYTMRIWNREEEDTDFTSPEPRFPVELCNETNVLVFNDFYEDKGLNSTFSVTIPWQLLPRDAGGATSERGWASMDFFNKIRGVGIDPSIEANRWIGDSAGLPVTGWLFSVFNTNDLATNHSAINAHKYLRDANNTALLTLVNTVTNNNGGGGAAATDWTLNAFGPNGISGVTGDPSVTGAEVQVGTTYTLIATGPASYTAGAWQCDGGTLVGDQLTLAPGDEVTCTINHDDIRTPS